MTTELVSQESATLGVMDVSCVLHIKPFFLPVESSIPSVRVGLAQAERLREGYRYSVPSGVAIATRCYCPVHPFIVVIEVSTLQHTRRCVRNKCLRYLLVFRILVPRTESAKSCSLLDVGGREATLLL